MKSIPIQYNLRNLRIRWRTSLATALGIALVVAVFVLVMSLAGGLRATFLQSGDPRNLLVFRKGALAESSSQITLDEVRRVKFLEGIERTAAGEPLVSPEMIILITLNRGNGGKAHVQVRGIGPAGAELRSSVQLVEGRMFQPGRRECIVSRNVARRFPECQPGRRFRSGKHEWQVVGTFDARQTAYDSEIWMDVDEAREAFNRSFYCSVVVRPRDAASAAALTRRIEAERATHLRAVTEIEYYREQTKTATPLQIFGASLAIIMSIGAVFSAMNTMYAAVGSRAREIGTLRMLGFQRKSIYLSFIVECLILSLVGGALGCVLALPIHGMTTGAFNWSTFAEVAFELRISPSLLGAGMAFALLMGLLGGILPARLAARRPILDALRAS